MSTRNAAVTYALKKFTTLQLQREVERRFEAVASDMNYRIEKPQDLTNADLALAFHDRMIEKMAELQEIKG